MFLVNFKILTFEVLPGRKRDSNVKINPLALQSDRMFGRRIAMMKRLIALFSFVFVSLIATAQAKPPSPEEAYAIGVEAYTYAYPLVLMELTRQVAASAPDPDQMHAPINRFSHRKTFPDARFKDVVRPNADTLYSWLWYDVGSEPLILTLPDTGGRYHVIPLMDMWTDVFASLGTRTTGNGGGTFAIVGPDWKGDLPAGTGIIRSPTSVGWIIGRFQTNGPKDYPNVHKLQAGLLARPLSSDGAAASQAAGPSLPAADRSVPPVVQAANMQPAQFFALFADLLKRNPPHASDYAIVRRMERLGLVVGKDFDLATTDPVIQQAMTRAASDGYQRIVNRRSAMRPTATGWMAIGNSLGVYGNDYLQRAFVAYAGLGALPAEEAIYPMAAFDGQGKPLTGASRYMIRFEKDQIPPADAFWSLTMYGQDQFFVENPLQRFALGDRDNLKFNPDGSLELYVQATSPGPDKEANWLPAPAGAFTMNMRLYLPRPEAIDGRWSPPAIRPLGD